MGYPPRKETGVFCCRWSLNRYKYSCAVAIGSLPGSVRCRHSCWDARIPKDSWLSEKGMREQRYTKSENVAGSRAKRTAGSLPGSIHKSLLLEKHFGLWNVFQAVIRTSREAWPQWVIWCPQTIEVGVKLQLHLIALKVWRQVLKRFLHLVRHFFSDFRSQPENQTFPTVIGPHAATSKVPPAWHKPSTKRFPLVPCWPLGMCLCLRTKQLPPGQAVMVSCRSLLCIVEI